MLFRSVARQRAALGADDAGGGRLLQPERRADGQHRVADHQRVGVTQAHRRQAAGGDAQHRDIGGGVADFTADFGSDPESLGTCVQCTRLFEDGTLQNVNAFLSLPDNITIQIQSDVPEPASLALVGLGLFGVAALRRKPQQ